MRHLSMLAAMAGFLVIGCAWPLNHDPAQGQEARKE